MAIRADCFEMLRVHQNVPENIVNDVFPFDAVEMVDLDLLFFALCGGLLLATMDTGITIAL